MSSCRLHEVVLAGARDAKRVVYAYMRTLLIATGNTGKLTEMRALFHDLPFALVGLTDVPGLADLSVEETASTFEGNALIKAFSYAHASGLLTLAEDSGLEVDALDGAPGVQSARWVTGSDADRNTALLAKLAQVPDAERTARFRTVIAIVEPATHSARTCTGRAEGVIVDTPRGEGGFGYDPIFRYAASGKTGGEMTRDEKNTVSHRQQACRAAKALLADFSA